MKVTISNINLLQYAHIAQFCNTINPEFMGDYGDQRKVMDIIMIPNTYFKTPQVVSRVIAQMYILMRNIDLNYIHSSDFYHMINKRGFKQGYDFIVASRKFSFKFEFNFAYSKTTESFLTSFCKCINTIKGVKIEFDLQEFKSQVNKRPPSLLKRTKIRRVQWMPNIQDQEELLCHLLQFRECFIPKTTATFREFRNIALDFAMLRLTLYTDTNFKELGRILKYNMEHGASLEYNIDHIINHSVQAEVEKAEDMQLVGMSMIEDQEDDDWEYLPF